MGENWTCPCCLTIAYPRILNSAYSKTLVSERLKQSGMRWTIRGGQAILTLRGLLQSDRWENAWRLLALSYKAEVRVAKTSTGRKAA